MLKDLRLTSKDTKAAVISGIRACLLELDTATKAELVDRLQVSFPTISKFLTGMEADGEVISVGLDKSSGGRRAKRYIYNPNYMLGLAVLLEKEETHYTIFNPLGEVIAEGSAHSVLASDVGKLITLIKEIKKQHPTIKSVAIGVPGAVNNGKVFYIPGYEHYQNLELKKIVEEQTEILAVIENDMNAAVLGYRGEIGGTEKTSIIYLYLGQNGPGAGIIMNDEIVRGKSFFSGEVSFIPQYDDKNFGEVLITKRSNISVHPEMEQKIDAISRLVGTVAAIINPHYFIFKNDEVDTVMLNQIRERSCNYAPEEHLPELAVSNWKQDYLLGLQQLSLELLITQTIE